MLVSAKNIYCYAKADVMVGHGFSDDVCLCLAYTKRGAYKKLSKLYGDIQMKDITMVRFKRWNYLTDIFVCTDY